MRTPHLVLLATVGLLTAVPAPAQATTIGSVAPEGVDAIGYPANALVYQETKVDGSPGFEIPAGVKVLTSFSLRARSTGTPTSAQFAIVRPTSTARKFTIVTVSDPFVATEPGKVATFPVRIPVTPGDVLTRISTGTRANYAVGYPTGGAPEDVLRTTPVDENASTGSPVDADDLGASSAASYRLNLAATAEADADGDGYGDETQDACPADPARFQGTCSADASLTQAVGAAALTVDQTTSVTVNVTNPAAGPLASPFFSTTYSAGLVPTAVTITAGTCAITGQQVTCDLAGLGTPGSILITQQLRAAAAGAQAVTSQVGSTTPDPQSANNTATTGITVAAKPVPKPQCKVPSLKGLRLDKARTKLTKAGCKVGKLTRPKVRVGVKRPVYYVVSQRIKAGTKVASGTKVGLTLRPKAKQKKR